MPKEAIVYLPIGEHVELRLSIQARFYNGIDSDPRTLTREPSLTEVHIMIENLKHLGSDAFHFSPTINYPERP